MSAADVKLAFRSPATVLATGSHTKNTVCLVRKNSAYLSPVHNDLGVYDDYQAFVKDVDRFMKLRPRIAAYDLHPGYRSTVFVSEGGLGGIKAIGIGHHHAHIASCMAENGLKNEKVIGVAFDGTGMGTDSGLWGAEFLVCDYKSCRRLAHLEEVPLIGGERAIAEPWRLACFWLHGLYGNDFLKSDIPFVSLISLRKWRLIRSMQVKGVNCPLSSSMGRLFDAAAAIILGEVSAGLEAELAIKLERQASFFRGRAKAYGFALDRRANAYIIRPQGIFGGIVSDIKKGLPRAEMAYKFHLSIAQMSLLLSRRIRQASGIEKVVLSGGVFQNNILLKLALGLLYKSGFKVFIHKKLSCSDSGISLGQAVIAAFSGG